MIVLTSSCHCIKRCVGCWRWGRWVKWNWGQGRLLTWCRGIWVRHWLLLNYYYKNCLESARTDLYWGKYGYIPIKVILLVGIKEPGNSAVNHGDLHLHLSQFFFLSDGDYRTTLEQSHAPFPAPRPASRSRPNLGASYAEKPSPKQLRNSLVSGKNRGWTKNGIFIHAICRKVEQIKFCHYAPAWIALYTAIANIIW